MLVAILLFSVTNLKHRYILWYKDQIYIIYVQTINYSAHIHNMLITLINRSVQQTDSSRKTLLILIQPGNPLVSHGRASILAFTSILVTHKSPDQKQEVSIPIISKIHFLFRRWSGWEEQGNCRVEFISKKHWLQQQVTDKPLRRHSFILSTN